MSEDHIKTVVLDPPPGRTAAKEIHEDEVRGDDTPEPEQSSGNEVNAPPRSWLS